MLKLIRAEADDFEKIKEFYKFVIENTETMSTYCRWVYGKHPNDELIHRYIGEGAMYYIENEKDILSAVVILPYQEEDYHEVEWGAELADDEVAVLHILCTNPEYKRQGLARQTMEAVADFAKSAGKKAVRLDTLESNLAAQQLYGSIGYKKIAVKHWFYPSAGYENLILYEMML